MATSDQAAGTLAEPCGDDATLALQQALAPLCDPGSGKSLLELGWIGQIRRQGERAVFRLALPGFAASQRERIASEAREALLRVAGIADVQIELAQPSDHAGGAPIGAAGHGPGATAAHRPASRWRACVT